MNDVKLNKDKKNDLHIWIRRIQIIAILFNLIWIISLFVLSFALRLDLNGPFAHVTIIAIWILDLSLFAFAFITKLYEVISRILK